MHPSTLQILVGVWLGLGMLGPGGSGRRGGAPAALEVFSLGGAGPSPFLPLHRPGAASVGRLGWAALCLVCSWLSPMTRSELQAAEWGETHVASASPVPRAHKCVLVVKVL